MGSMAGGAADAVPVSDEEDVARLCFRADFPITHDGKHQSEVDETGFYRLEEFQWKDFSDPRRGGFSVQRTSLFTQADAARALENRIANKTAKGKPTDGYALEGVVLARVGNVHGIKDPKGQSAFKVTPEPLEGQPAHASIRATCSSGEFIKFREELRLIFGQVQNVEVLPEAATEER